VELALIAPLFLSLLAGIIEFGQAFRIQHSLSHAARRGARAAIVDGATTEQVVQRIRTACVLTLGVDEEDVIVEIAVNGNPSMNLSLAEQSDEIRVSVQVPYSKAGAGFYAQTFSGAMLTSTCTLEHE